MASPRSGIQVVRPAPQVGRVMRTPEHTFRFGNNPLQITPFLLMPVVPGETMKNLLVNARMQSVSIFEPLMGWWHEMYFFYVKHRDLPNAEEAMAMHLQQGADMSALETAADPWMYQNAGTPRINWMRQCLDAVVNEYFRDEDETSADGTYDGMPLAHLGAPTGVLQSAVIDLINADNPGDETLPGEEPQQDAFYANLPPEFQPMYRAWQDMTAMRLTTATYEDFLKSHGVRPPVETRVEEIARPELIRYIREWTYPNVAMVSGSAVHQIRMDITERADKDRFFAEPGFIFGCQVIKPKIYLAEQHSNAATLLSDAYAWLPAVLWEQSYTSLQKIDVSAGEGIMRDDAGGADWWLDRKDLFVHGDQFVNWHQEKFNDPNWDINYPDVGSPSVQAWDPTIVKSRYPLSYENFAIDLFSPDGFVPASVPSVGGIKAPFMTDGVVRASILSRIEDTSL